MEKITKVKEEATQVGKNIIDFIQATSLVVVAAYGGYAVKQHLIIGTIAYVIAGAASIIAVRGGWELLAHFRKS